ncbi:MAG: hypothetical protein ACXAC7_09080 [Candidatus Hodarchaeales archaeon]|jgi:hypothetical protein
MENYGSEQINQLVSHFNNPRTISLSIKLNLDEWVLIKEIMKERVMDEIILGLHPANQNDSFFVYRSALSPSNLLQAPFSYIPAKTDDIKDKVQEIALNQLGIGVEIEKFLFLVYVTFRFDDQKIDDSKALIFLCKPKNGSNPRLMNPSVHNDLRLISLEEYQEKLTERITKLKYGYTYYRYVLTDHFLKMILNIEN